VVADFPDAGVAGTVLALLLADPLAVEAWDVALSEAVSALVDVASSCIVLSGASSTAILAVGLLDVAARAAPPDPLLLAAETCLDG
jgi:2-polyprenyl-6-methoxyphenol hydroxylase-like FAD-dependent oxidoreductase